MKIELRANAKINLFLDILAKLPNGYHSLFMVMQSVSLADTVTVQENGEDIIRLTCSEPALPTDSKNIAYRAAQAFLAEAGLSGRGVDIHIEKNIPFEGVETFTGMYDTEGRTGYKKEKYVPLQYEP